MKAKKYWIWVGILTISGSVLWASKLSKENATLYFPRENKNILMGLKDVNVLVEGLNADAKEVGLTEKQLQIDVELRLRIAGITVLSEDESIAGASPYLYVNVNVVKMESLPLYAVNIDVNFKELVVLLRNPKITAYGSTWDTSLLCLNGKDIIESNVRGNIRDLVDKFINDYLAANPKESEAKRKS